VCAVLPNDASELHSRNSRQSADGGQSTSVWNWAAASVVSSTPTLHNRFAPLQSTDDDGDEPPFVEYHWRRSIKRQRQQSEQQRRQQEPQQQQQHQPERQNRDNTQRRGCVLMTGKHSGNDEGIKAANKIVKKAVFCVDNVQKSYVADDLARFVSTLNVKVISCFKVNPRRRQNETDPVTDRSAFRLCIVASDRDRLLDVSKWPEHVVISDWYFVNPVARQQRPVGAPEEKPCDDPTVTPVDMSNVANNRTVSQAAPLRCTVVSPMQKSIQNGKFDPL